MILSTLFTSLAAPLPQRGFWYTGLESLMIACRAGPNPAMSRLELRRHLPAAQAYGPMGSGLPAPDQPRKNAASLLGVQVRSASIDAPAASTSYAGRACGVPGTGKQPISNGSPKRLGNSVRFQ